jgi:hypothetical protein
MVSEVLDYGHLSLLLCTAYYLMPEECGGRSLFISRWMKSERERQEVAKVPISPSRACPQ